MNERTNHMRDRLFHLRRQFRPRTGLARGLLDASPWIDVILLALLFVITQSATIKKPGLQVQLPVAIATSGARYDSHVLTVPQEGVYFFGDQRVNWTILSDRLREAATNYPDGELIIEADESLTHRTLTGIYNLAVDAGWQKIVLATRIDSRPESRP